MAQRAVNSSYAAACAAYEHLGQLEIGDLDPQYLDAVIECRLDRIAQFEMLGKRREIEICGVDRVFMTLRSSGPPTRHRNRRINHASREHWSNQPAVKVFLSAAVSRVR
jgi:hypothetical protein